MSFFMSGESSKSAWRIGEWGHFPGDFFRSLANEKNLKIGYVTWALRGYLDRRALRGSCFHLPFLAILKCSCSIILVVAQPFHFCIWILTFPFFWCGTLILKPLNRNIRKAVHHIKVPGGGGVEWGHDNTRIYSVYTTVSMCIYIYYIYISLFIWVLVFIFVCIYTCNYIYIYIYV